MSDQSQNRSSKPFLRWAGGKNWLVKYLPDLINDLDFNDYHEPFFGGGSVFFALSPDRALLSDINEELINTYVEVRDNVESVIGVIDEWGVNEKQYYAIRAEEPDDAIRRAARFIYLNRTSFNGIYRVNRKGQYNVPYGKRMAIDSISSEFVLQVTLAGSGVIRALFRRVFERRKGRRSCFSRSAIYSCAQQQWLYRIQ